jgi:hypothetical protein
MKEVNDAARQTIVKLIEEGPHQPEKSERQAFAAWVTMFSMTYEFADLRTMVTTPEERRILMQTKRAPDHWSILIGSYSGTAWTEMNNHRALGPVGAYKPTGQCNVFTLGKTLVVALSGLGLGNTFSRAFATKHGLAEIWPNLGPMISLPQLSDSDVDLIAGVGEPFVRPNA